jgi:hypothetical protein
MVRGAACIIYYIPAWGTTVFMFHIWYILSSVAHAMQSTELYKHKILKMQSEISFFFCVRNYIPVNIVYVHESRLPRWGSYESQTILYRFATVFSPVGNRYEDIKKLASQEAKLVSLDRYWLPVWENFDHHIKKRTLQPGDAIENTALEPNRRVTALNFSVG